MTEDRIGCSVIESDITVDNCVRF